MATLEAHRNDHERAAIHLNDAHAIFHENVLSHQARSIEHALRYVLERFSAKIPLTKVAETDPVLSVIKSSLERVPILVNWNLFIYESCQRLRGYTYHSDLDIQPVQKTCLRMLDHKLRQIGKSDQMRYDNLRTAYLRIQYHTCRLILPNLNKPRLQMFNDSDEEFQVIVERCRVYSTANYKVEASLATANAHAVRLGYCIEFVLNIFFVAFECRDLSIRRSVIDFLRQNRRRE